MLEFINVIICLYILIVFYGSECNLIVIFKYKCYGIR